MQSWLLFACVAAWCLSSLGFMWIHGCVDSCRFLPMSTHVDSCQRRFMFMPTRFKIDIGYCRFLPMSKHVEVVSNHCRLTSISVMVNVDSLRCQLWPITAHVDVDNCYCRHSVHRVVQRIQLILATSSTLRLGRWIWITRRPSPSHWPRRNYKLGPTYTTILLFWCIFNIHCNNDHIAMAACYMIASIKRLSFVCVSLHILRAYNGDRWRV